MTQAYALYQLQQLDTSIDEVNARLKQIDELLSQNEAVRAAKEAFDNAEANRLHWQTRFTDLDLERKQLKAEAVTTEEKLYSGRVSNHRELSDLQDKLAELRTRDASMEDPLLEAMMNLEEANDTLSQSQSNYEQVKAQEASKMSELVSEQERLETDLAKFLQQIDPARQLVQAQHLTLYDQLRKRSGGKAVTLVHAKECGICGVELTTRLLQQVKRGEVHQCTTCERILSFG